MAKSDEVIASNRCRANQAQDPVNQGLIRRLHVSDVINRRGFEQAAGPLYRAENIIKPCTKGRALSNKVIGPRAPRIKGRSRYSQHLPSLLGGQPGRNQGARPQLSLNHDHGADQT